MTGLLKVAALLGFLLVVYADDITWKENTVDVKTNDAATTTFKLRYLSSDYFSKNQQNPPAIVHLTYGDQAETIADEQKYINSMAQQLNATLYVVEHRYFGKSPTTNPTFTDYATVKDIDATEAIKDIKLVIAAIRNKNTNVNIILTGSVYAGELAMLLRKDDSNIYGSVVFGSALRLHKDMGATLGQYDKQLKDAYTKEGCKVSLIQGALKLIGDTEVKTGDEASKTLATDILNGLNLTNKASNYNNDKEAILTYIHTALEGLAQENYDVKHDHGKFKFDRRPLMTYCNDVKNLGDNPTTTADKVKPLLLLIAAYYQNIDTNDQQKHTITDIKPDIRNAYVDCFVTAPYHCRLGGQNDDFPAVCGNENDFGTWKDKLEPRCTDVVKNPPQTALDTLGDSFKTLVNGFDFGTLQKTIYVFGDRDPNSAGRFAQVDASKQQFQFLIQGSTKDAALHKPTNCDADNLNEARYKIINIIKCWLANSVNGDCSPDNFNKDLKDFSYVSGNSCDEDKTLNYPWCQDGSCTNPTAATSEPGKTNAPGSTTPYSSAPETIQTFTHLSILAFAVLVFRF